MHGDPCMCMMVPVKLFLWQYVGQVSDSYHCGGGLAVIALDERVARELIAAEKHVEVTEEEWAEVRVLALDHIVEAYEPEVIVFPDAGCC